MAKRGGPHAEVRRVQDQDTPGAIGAQTLQAIGVSLRILYNRHLSGHHIGTMTPQILGEVEALSAAFQWLARTVTAETPLSEVKTGLLMLATTEAVRARIGEACPGLKLKVEDLREHHRNEGLQVAGNLRYEMEGQDFFHDHPEPSRTSPRNNVNFATQRGLIACETELRSRPPKTYAECVPLLLLCLGGDAMTTIRVIEAQTKGWAEETTRQEDQETFFDEFLRFIAVYADISQHLIRESNPGVAGALRQRSRETLKEILADQRLQVVSKEGMPRASLFNLLQERFATDPSNQSPWFIGDAENIPFDPKKIGTLIRRAIPRQAFADVMVELNDHAYRSTVREIRHFLQTYETVRSLTPTRQKKFNEWCDTLIQKANLDIATTDTLEQKVAQLQTRFTELSKALETLSEEFADVLRETPADDERPEHCERRVNHLIRKHQLGISQEAPLQTKLSLLRSKYGMAMEQGGMPLHVEALLIRLLGVKKIFEQEDLQKEVAALIESIGRKMEEVRQWDPKKRAMLGLSIKQALTQGGSEEDQGRLDVPLGGLKNRSLRHHLAGLARATLEPEEIAFGFSGEEGAVIPVVDQEGLEMTKDDIPLSKNFDIAGPEAPHRKRLHRAGRALVSRFPKAKAFDRTVEFVSAQANEYFHSKEKKGRDTFLYFPYSSGTAAWKTDLMHEVLGKCTEEDNVVITNQEYGAITEIIEGKSATVKVVYLNEPEGEGLAALDEETLFQRLKDSIEPERTKLIDLSSQTRFGDRLCGKQGREGFVRLCRRLKEAYPDIPLLVDGCQSIGRGLPDDLEALGADFYLISGAKAHGVKGCGLLGISKKYLAKTIPNLEEELRKIGIIKEKIEGENEEAKQNRLALLLSHDVLRRLKERRGVQSQFHYDPGTMDIDQIAAMGIGLNLLRGIDDGFRIEGNCERRSYQRLDLKIAKHMSQLTQHAIETARQYGASFRSTHAAGLPEMDPEGTHDPYGAEVIYPVHRNPKSYNGILTIAFPSMNGAMVAEKLEQRGVQVHPCLDTKRGIRISFHYLHKTEDIDGLFQAIQSVQAEVVRDRMQREIPPRNIRTREWVHDYRQAA